jgi:hypothetical protein
MSNGITSVDVPILVIEGVEIYDPGVRETRDEIHDEPGFQVSAHDMPSLHDQGPFLVIPRVQIYHYRLKKRRLTDIGDEEDINEILKEGKEAGALHVKGDSIGDDYRLIEDQEEPGEVPRRLEVGVGLNRLEPLLIYLLRLNCQ